VKAFLTSGEEIGVLTAFSGFHRTQHDLALRQSVMRAIRDKELAIAPGEDPIAAFNVLKATQALARRTNQRTRRHVINPEATELARALQKSALPVPTISESVPGKTAIRSPGSAPDSSPTPSFVPRVRHRGIVR
jgi:hypothetical protein